MTLRGLPPRLRWFIVVVATAGLAASAAVVLLDPGHWDRSVWPRLAVLLVLTAASEIAGLRLPHRGALEMLNLYEGMVVANIALLPAGQAIAVSLAGLLVAQVVQRRAPVKAVFNLGMYATALAPAIGLYHLVAGDAGLLSARGMTAMAVAIAIFALVNLLLISQLLAVIEDRPLWDVVQESSKLSILIFLGNSAVGLIGVVLWLREPVALPAVLLPAATLWLAYRSAERQMQERDRFQHLYEVGQAFASSLVLEEVLPNVLPKVARLFGAEEAHLLFAQGAGRPFGAIHGPDGFRFGPADPADLTALALLGEGTSPVVGRPGQAPEGWPELLVAPLVAQGRHLGVIVLGNLRQDRHAEAGAGMRLGRQDLQLLSPLASGLAVTLGNATQVAQIKEEKSTLEQILGLSSDGILLLDGKGRVRVWNQAMERICGVASDDAVGLPYNEPLAGLDHDGKLVRLEDLLAAATPARPRPRPRCRSAPPRAWSGGCAATTAAVRGRGVTTDVVIVHDVTRIRQAERAKTDFVATVSHELRTPITPIKGYVEILQARAPTCRRTSARTCWGSWPSGPTTSPGWSKTSCWRRGSPRSRAARPWSTCGASAPTRPRRPPGGCRLAARPRKPAGAGAAGGAAGGRRRPLRLVQVLANLISNAHKYSPTDQEVRLRVWRDNGWALAAVADRGRGIPREELDRVFEKFHRVEDPMTMTTGGTGLGLYIARELTRAMGGEIETTSAPRRGSTFTVRLPMARSREGGEDAGAPGRDRGDDTQPPRTKARRLPDPLCRSS
jgi:PAS domain S-box-containing protein